LLRHAELKKRLLRSNGDRRDAVYDFDGKGSVAPAVGQRLLDFRPTAEQFRYDDVKTAIDVRESRFTGAVHGRRRFFSGNFEFHRFIFFFFTMFSSRAHTILRARFGDASDTCPPPPIASNRLSVSRHFQEFRRWPN